MKRRQRRGIYRVNRCEIACCTFTTVWANKEEEEEEE